jgi:hypothetical protein
MNETLGGIEDSQLGNFGFSFTNTANSLAEDLINSLVVGVKVDLDFAFGLDLNPMFNSSAKTITERIPDPFIRINQFDISGIVGINEWSTNLRLSDGEFNFQVAEAKALINISSSLTKPPLLINSPSDVTGLFNKTDVVTFSSSLDVEFPVFLIFGDPGVGFGARIEYK